MLEVLEPRRLLSAGDPDPTFGVGGRVEGSPNPELLLTDAALTSDDKVLFAGRLGGEYLLQRFNADGTPDAGFGTGGTATGPGFTILEIVPQADGKVVARGIHGPIDLMARFTASGALDPTFGGGDGVAEIGSAIHPTAFGVMADGRILIVHDRTSIGGDDAQLTRYNADGSIDAAFGGGDGVFFNPAGLSSIHLIEPYPDGSVLLSGGVFVSGEGSRAAIARLEPDGAPDDSFGAGGRIEAPAGDFVLLPDDRFLAVSRGPGGFSTVRFDANGSVDTSFAGGELIVPAGDSLFDIEAHLDGDGNAVLFGETFTGTVVTRITGDGRLDESFGRVIAAERTGFGYFLGGGVQSSGKPVLMWLGPDQSQQRYVITRLLGADVSDSPIVLDPVSRELSIPGTSAHDVIRIEDDGNVLQVSRNGVGRVFDVADVASLSISGRVGDDLIDVTSSSVPAHINGGDGIDRIAGGRGGDTLVGAAGRDFIDAGDGNDSIFGGAGNDQLRGQGGDDMLDGGDDDDELRGNAGLDTYEGGPGDDLEIDIDDPHVSFQDGLLRFFDPLNDADVVSIFPDGAGGLVIYVDGQTDTIPMDLVSFIELNGNGGDDYLKVHPLLDIRAVIYGGIGPHTDRAGGNDTLIGGAASDTLIGHGGNDFLFANGGNDHLQGGEGADIFRGHGGRDTADYTSSDDNLTITLDGVQDDGYDGENDLVFSDVERVLGGSGDDRIVAGLGNHILFGGDGKDTLDAGAGHDALYGAGGDDFLEAGEGDDYVEGGAGDDLLAGGPGADQLFGLAGNDRFFADDAARDIVRGGPGSDTAETDQEDDVLAVETIG